MKTIKLLTIVLFLSFKGFAQNNEKLNLALQKGLVMIDSAKGEKGYQDAANYFERIAAAEQKQWLPAYYTAFCQLHTALLGKQTTEIKDAVYDKALAFVDKADAISPDNSEVYALKGYVVFMKMSLTPQARAMTMIPEATGIISKSIALNSENPRAQLMLGQTTFYTPEAFGGGKLKAKPLLEAAKAKFDKETSTGLNPSWGKSRCLALLQQSN
jgi:tetratricopeptide (TPR) repeat protein